METRSQGSAPKSWTSKIILAILVAGVIFQASFVVQQYAWPRLVEIDQLRGQPSWYRSAAIRTNPKQADFIEFLRTEIPAGSRVILPTTTGDSPFNYHGIMQYYLFPRTIVACRRSILATCVRENRPAFIVQTGGFPDRSAVPTDWGLTSYEERSGVYFAPCCGSQE
jgi:hypothetical protein